MVVTLSASASSCRARTGGVPVVSSVLLMMSTSKLATYSATTRSLFATTAGVASKVSSRRTRTGPLVPARGEAVSRVARLPAVPMSSTAYSIRETGDTVQPKPSHRPKHAGSPRSMVMVGGSVLPLTLVICAKNL